MTTSMLNEDERREKVYDCSSLLAMYTFSLNGEIQCTFLNEWKQQTHISNL